ncbi:uncharacterized protein LOC123667782 [Melitaea cinxia]|uniref:uncharacterized protein LOC123667782 n=1 Tax=Melitaea cinxia TaxID=113334 RepID=UPI001E271449|nr:uncharacterized protein LOC123667782 [Melitaea cinxia]
MSPYDKGAKLICFKVEGIQGHIIAEGSESSSNELKYMQVLDSDKNVVVDLLNLTLVRCEDGQEAYRLVSNDGESGDDTTVTCVLSNEDCDDRDNQESYVVLEGEQGPMVFLQSSLPQTNQSKPIKTEPKEVILPKIPVAFNLKSASRKVLVSQILEWESNLGPFMLEKPKMTPAEILERAKALQKAKALMSIQPTRGRSRKRKSELPPPHELLSSPQFKLFLYSCKLCSFKCNAIKELTAHKAAEHGGGSTRWRGGGRAAASALQCARCPYRGATHTQLMKHVKEKHLESSSTADVSVIGARSGQLLLESSEVLAADVLVCGACGFESGEREVFRDHIEQEHGVSPC